MTTQARKRILGTLCAVVLGAAAHAGIAAEALPVSYNLPSADDEKSIRMVLTNYTTSVSEGDRQLFESQLLDLKIPFAAISAKQEAGKADLAAFQDYKGFRAAIFDGGVKYRQRFSNIKIEQLGSLAQVSLDYETTVQREDYKGKGWKVLQLVKVGTQWKIASEFWTGYPRR